MTYVTQVAAELGAWLQMAKARHFYPALHFLSLKCDFYCFQVIGTAVVARATRGRFASGVLSDMGPV
jgi:hypothetical protein